MCNILTERKLRKKIGFGNYDYEWQMFQYFFTIDFLAWFCLLMERRALWDRTEVWALMRACMLYRVWVARFLTRKPRTSAWIFTNPFNALKAFLAYKQKWEKNGFLNLKFQYTVSLVVFFLFYFSFVIPKINTSKLIQILLHFKVCNNHPIVLMYFFFTIVLMYVIHT